MRDEARPFTAVRDVHKKVAILDTNLLVLWISARLGIHNLSHFKRIKSFTDQDAQLLYFLLAKFRA